MKKTIILFLIVLSFNLLKSQVGIGNINPKSTLDVRGINHLGTATVLDGISVPRVNKLPDLNPSLEDNIHRQGQLLYLIEPYGIFSSKGLYYWDGNNWIFKSSGIEPWNLEGSVEKPTLNTQNIYQMGKVGIGTNNPTTNLELVGSLKIKNGTEGNNKILNSDINGKTSWQDVAKLIINIGTISSTGLTIPYNTTGYLSSGTNIIIPPNSKYSVEINILINPSVAFTSGQGVTMNVSFSDVSNGTTISTDIKGNNTVKGYIPYPINYSMLTGRLIIENNTSLSKTYYLIAGNLTTTGGWTGNIVNFGSTAFGENNILAIPVTY